MRLKKLIPIALIAICTLVGLSTTDAYAGTWKQEGGGYRYYNDDGSYKATEWLQEGGSWYYLDYQGYAHQNEWAQINGSWYYFDSTGRMATNQWIGSYYVDGSGVWQQTATSAATTTATRTKTTAVSSTPVTTKTATATKQEYLAATTLTTPTVSATITPTAHLATAGVGITTPTLAATTPTGVNSYSYLSAQLTAEEAQQKALAKVSGATTANLYEWKTDYKHGKLEYKGTIYYNNMEYHFHINGYTGNITEWKEKILWDTSAYSYYTATSLISADSALQTVLDRVPGASAANVYEWRLDYKHDKIEYKGKLIYGTTEYHFHINALTGTMREWKEKLMYDY